MSLDVQRQPRIVVEPETSAVGPVPAQPLRILIVEDECIVACDFQEVLKGFGYDPYAIASSADEALEFARRERPDIVLMDIHIVGDVDGIQAAVRLRQEFAVAVIFVSAYADEATVQRAMALGPSAYLIKPVSARGLQTAIELVTHPQGLALPGRSDFPIHCAPRVRCSEMEY